jgi:hypothetical protein
MMMVSPTRRRLFVACAPLRLTTVTANAALLIRAA